MRVILAPLIEFLGPALIEHIYSGVDLEVRGMEHLQKLNGKSHVLTFWHGRLLVLFHFFKNRDYRVLISESDDGEYITRLVEPFGITAVRGSTTRGASRVMLQASKMLRDVGPVAFTVDGPKGPRHVVQAGAVAASHLAKVPILPVTASTSIGHVFNSWDKFVVPKYGSKTVLNFLPPFASPPKDDIENTRLTLEKYMIHETEKLDDELGLKIPPL